MNPSDFYRRFEDRHRGSPALIEQRLTPYLDLIKPLLDSSGDLMALDLGCGRGEWLSLLRKRGIRAQGVDLDPQMLGALADSDQPVFVADALEFLQGMASASVNLITAFHLVEHLPFETLLSLLTEAYRALKPGGLIILETPNPENLFVSGHGFHLDPSHLKPLPPPLLDFSVEYAGFAKTRILRMHPLASEEESARVALWDVIGGACQDYAVLGQKEGTPAQMNALNAWFEQDTGLTPHQLARRLDAQGSHALNEVRQKLHEVSADLEGLKQAHTALEERQTLEQRLVVAETRLEERAHAEQEAKSRADQQKNIIETLETALTALRLERDQEKALLSQRAETYRAEAIRLETELKGTRDQALAWHEQIHQIQRSFSWRMTAPIRLLRSLLLYLWGIITKTLAVLLEGLILLILLPISPLLIIALRWVLKRPGPRDRLGQQIARYPRLRRRLRTFASWVGLLILETDAPKTLSNEPPLVNPRDAAPIQPLGRLSGQIFRILNEQRP